MQQLARLDFKPRFLYGRVRPETEAETVPPQSAQPAAKKAKPKAKPRPNPAPQVEPRRPQSVPIPQNSGLATETARSESEPADQRLHAHEPVPNVRAVAKDPAPPREIITGLIAHVINFLIILGFGTLVFQLVMWLSARELNQLVTFSFIPILFSILGFVFLYFWLFLGTFQKTLGRILAEQLFKRILS